MAELEGTTLLGRYFLRQLVDSGGMADVYLAWDRMRSAKMAIKVLRKDPDKDPHVSKSFEKEANVLRRLEHPHIVRIYEFERDGQIFFIVMDWVEGKNLRQAITERGRPYTPSEISPILLPVCNALHYAHQRQVYHCDVKPANIMMHVDNRILLADFGVANLRSEQRIAGTPPYMSPEQFRGEKVDRRTDVYGLGVTLYEMASGGHLPFKGDTPNSQGTTARERIEWEQRNLEIPPIAQFNPKLPRSIEAVITKALENSPQHRYSSVLELRDAFEGARSEAPEPKPSIRDTIEGTVAWEVPKLPPIPEIQIKFPTPKPQLNHRRVTGPRLVGRSGAWIGQEVQIPRQGLTIGRGSQSQLRLNDRTVSRVHAVIIRTKHGVTIRDENSSVGTYVNNKRIYGPVRLKEGDVIHLGHNLAFEFRRS